MSGSGSGGAPGSGTEGAGAGSSSVPAWFHQAVARAEEVLDAGMRRWGRNRTPEDLRIVSFGGHTGPARTVVRARVLDDRKPDPPQPGEQAWRSAVRMLRRFETDELPGVELEVRIAGRSWTATTDEEGYLHLDVPEGLASSAPHTDDGGRRVPAGDAPDGVGSEGPEVVDDVEGAVGVDGLWREGTIRLAAPYRGVTEAASPLRVVAPGAASAFGVISDVDDTVLRTGAQRLADMVRTTVLGNALTREAFPGVGELYRGLAGGDGTEATRPFFYVSSSPWNLYEFLVAFLEHQDLPTGPLLLRDLGVDRERFIKGGHGDHKLGMIEEVVTTHPDLRFVLVGDSGQHDPEIYREVIDHHPGRIAAVYIRHVADDARAAAIHRMIDDASGPDVPVVLAADSAEIARHAADHGLLDPALVVAVEAAVRATT